MRAWVAGLVALAMAGCANDPAVPTTVTAPPAESTTSLIPTTATTVATSTTAAPTTTAPTTTTTIAPLQQLAYEVITEQARQPVLLVGAAGTHYLVERPGTVRILRPDGSLQPYLDLTDRVAQRGIEQGLHGLAFHPGFPDEGRLFAYYVSADDDNGRLVELSATTEEADPSTERVLATFDQAIIRHYGGMLTFGPEGYLWLSLGEGGAASIHAQDPDTPLGSLLRIDVDGADPYTAAPGNPFADGDAPGVWAYGLRNPWRFTIDEGLVYIADVGHERWEEINVVPLDRPGANFGWLRMEGPVCFQSGCDPDAEGLTLPAYAYSHEEGCSITGGFVYRGEAIPELEGEYLFSDWCEGWLRSYHHPTGQVTDWTDDVGVIGQVNGFGRDLDGEIYVLTWEGTVAKLVAQR